MEYKTDKVFNNLIFEYEVLFEDYKDSNINILEIGTYRGGFLFWLVDFFPNAQIIGGDIKIPRNLESLLKYSDRIKFHQLDQNNSESLKNVAKIYNKFDIIIDDGCHQLQPTRNTFETLWEDVKPNGLYIIEDFLVGYKRNRRFEGMVNLITDIMLKKNALNISDYGVIFKMPKCSLAYFKKENNNL